MYNIAKSKELFHLILTQDKAKLYINHLCKKNLENVTWLPGTHFPVSLSPAVKSCPVSLFEAGAEQKDSTLDFCGLGTHTWLDSLCTFYIH